MVRLIPSLLALSAAMLIATPAFAADYGAPWGGNDGNSGALRTAYPMEPSDWTTMGDPTDSLRFEFGLRYWYSMAAQSFSINSGFTGDHGTMNESDTSHAVEAHLRIDDDSTRTYIKGLAGYGLKTDGSSTDNGGTTTVTDGHLSYIGADFGYSAIGDGKNFGAGPFIGYMYWNNSPNTYHDNFTTATSSEDITFDPSTGQTVLPGNSVPNDIYAHMLRLGVSAKADLGGFLDFSADLAAVPYAKVNGTLGAGSGFPTSAAVNYDNQSGVGPTGPTGAVNVHSIQSSPTSIDGWGYGAMLEAMVGIHPTDHWTIRLGGRAWYVQGTADATFSRAAIGDPTDAVQPVDNSPNPPTLNPPNFDTPPTFGNQEYISRANPFSMMRYGLLAELTYAF